jgi:2-phosphosulfolactate phosphatase
MKFSCRCAWGEAGLAALPAADAIVVVDVLSFSTCVDVAAGRGAAIIPSDAEVSARALTSMGDVELAGPRGRSRYSLSPVSFLDAPRHLRCVLPSPNGGAISHRLSDRAAVFAGCLRNVSAVATTAARSGTTFNVCAAGERGPDGSLRHAVEDWLAAGAILSALPGAKSPDAEAAIAEFERALGRLAETIAESESGRELIARGYRRDVELAIELDVSGHAAQRVGGAFIAVGPQ